MLFFKRISDVYDEEYPQALLNSDGDPEYAEFSESHSFNIPKGYSWNDLKIVPTQQSINFAEALTKVLSGDKVTLEIIQGADHGTPEFNTKENIEKVMAFLDEYLK